MSDVTREPDAVPRPIMPGPEMEALRKFFLGVAWTGSIHEGGMGPRTSEMLARGRGTHELIPATRAWVLGWLGGPVLGMANGIVRERFFTDAMGEDAAQRFSTATLLSALALYMWALESRWPLPSSRTALRVGGTWALLTMAFELGLGRARHMPWSKLLGQYDITRGRVWVLVPLWMALGPAVMRALAEGSRAHGARTAL